MNESKIKIYKLNFKKISIVPSEQPFIIQPLWEFYNKT